MRIRAVFLITMFASLLSVSCAPEPELLELTIGSTVFSVEVARTDAQRQKGLMKRASLGEHEGMLFVSEKDEPQRFWMKDTLIPLSIAFISSTGKITEIRDMRPLSRDTVTSRFSCRYALEVNQGAFARAGIEEGAVVVFPEGFR